MTEYHTIYKGPEGETTQWEDIQRRLGNLPPKAPVWKPEKYTPEAEEVKDKAWVDDRDGEELSDLEDEFTDDRFMEEYRWECMLFALPPVVRACSPGDAPCTQLDCVRWVCTAARGRGTWHGAGQGASGMPPWLPVLHPPSHERAAQPAVHAAQCMAKPGSSACMAIRWGTRALTLP